MLRRYLSALFALWIAFMLAEPGMMHSCPMHGGAAGQHSAGMSHEHQASHQHHAPAGKSGESCTCDGECCAAVAVAPSEPSATFVAPPFVRQVAANVLVPASTAPRCPDLQLPFANGPPHVA